MYSKYLNNKGRLNSISVQIFTKLAVIREHKLPTSEGLPSYFMFPLCIQSLRSNNAILRCASTPHASSSPALPVPPPQTPIGAYGIIPPPANGAALCYRIASPCFACSLYLQKRLCTVPGSSHICCLKHLYRE